MHFLNPKQAYIAGYFHVTADQALTELHTCFTQIRKFDIYNRFGLNLTKLYDDRSAKSLQVSVTEHVWISGQKCTEPIIPKETAEGLVVSLDKQFQV